MEVEYMMQTTVVMLLPVEVCDCVVAEVLQDLYTTLVHIVGLGVVHEQMVVLVLVVVPMNSIVAIISYKLVLRHVNQVFKVVVMQVVSLIQVSYVMD